jgi:hypothetical protein
VLSYGDLHTLFIFHCLTRLSILVYHRDNFGYADAHMDRHLAPRQMAAATPGPADWREALDIVALGLPDQVMLLLTC